MRWCLRVCEGFPTGAAEYGADLNTDSRGAVSDKNRGARTHLTRFSFRAFRFATRAPAVVGALGTSSRQPPSQRQRKEKHLNAMTTPDDLRTIRHGTAVTNLQKGKACPKAGQNRRLHRSADPPSRGGANCAGARLSGLFFLDRARPVFFSTRGKRKWGVHPAGPAPAGAESPWPPDGGPYPLAPLVAASQQIVGSNAEVVRHFHQSRHIRIMPAALIILVLASTDFKKQQPSVSVSCQTPCAVV